LVVCRSAHGTNVRCHRQVAVKNDTEVARIVRRSDRCRHDRLVDDVSRETRTSSLTVTGP